MQRPGPRFEPGDALLFIDRKNRRYLKTLRAGGTVTVRGGKIDCERLVGLEEGSRVANSMGDAFLVLRPTYAELVLHLPRAAQVVYPKDAGPILVYGDVYAGATVVEAGSGPGALTIALLRAVGDGGRVITYEVREDHAKMARDNVARFVGETPNWRLEIGDVYERLPETDVDRVILDVPEPWRALDNVAAALRAGGVVVAYVPTALQVKTFVDETARRPDFAAVETFETLMRFWHVKGQSIRPEHRMVAHTGFITIARRLARERRDGQP